MANQIAQDKQRINLVISKSLVSQLDGIAARDGKTRSAVIVEALGAYVSGKPGTDSASGAKLDAVMLKLDAIASAQGELKAQQLAQSTVLADALLKYKELLDAGAISQEEFDAKKKELLAAEK